VIPHLSVRPGLCLHPDRIRPDGVRMRGVLSALPRILVNALPLPDQRLYESLQGRSEVGPLPTPRRCRVGLSRLQGSPM
jgi:hypothetical protein